MHPLILGSKMSRGRTIVFIDNSNVFQGQLAVGWRIDAKKLHEYLEREGDVLQSFFFASVTDPPTVSANGLLSIYQERDAVRGLALQARTKDHTLLKGRR